MNYAANKQENETQKDVVSKQINALKRSVNRLQQLRRQPLPPPPDLNQFQKLARSG